MGEQVQKLRLNNLKNCQKSLSRLIREYHTTEKADTVKYRTLTYMLKALLESYSDDRKYELEDRLKAIEAKLNI